MFISNFSQNRSAYLIQGVVGAIRNVNLAGNVVAEERDRGLLTKN